MKRILLIGVLSLFSLVLIIAAAAGVLLATINPNDYKEDIAEAVFKATGRQLVIQGDIGIQFFPNIGLQTGRLFMQDPPVFGADPLASVDSASLSLALGPLLQRRIEVQEVQLQGVTLKLVQTATGQKNWEMGKDKSKDAKATNAPGEVTPLKDEMSMAVPKKDEDKSMPMQLAVNSIRCRDITLIYRDLAAGESYRLGLDTLELNNVNFNSDTTVTLAGSADNVSTGQKAEFSLKALARVDEAVNAEGTLESLDIALSGGGKSLKASLSADFRYSVKSQALILKDIKLKAGDAALAGNLTLAFPTATSKGMGAKGTLNVAPLGLNALLADLNPILKAKAPKGGGGAPNMQNVTPGSGAATPAPQRVDRGTGKKGDALPPALTALDADLTITVERLVVDKIAMDAVKVQVLSDKGNAHAPYSLNIFGGSVQGTATADLRVTPPSLGVTSAIRAMRLEDALMAFTGEKTATGQVTGDIDVKAQGISWKQMAPTLSGKASARANTVDVKKFTLLPSEVAGVANVPQTFVADRVSASFAINSGVAVSRDMLLDSKVLQGNGGGTINLVSERLDLNMDFRVGGNPPAIPLAVKGSFSRPSVGIDQEQLLKNSAVEALSSPKVQEKIRKNLPKEAGKVLDGLFKQR